MWVENFVPGNITGFFGIKKDKTLENTGTTGAGVCISHGITAKMNAENAKKNSFTFYTNNKKGEIGVSKEVCKLFLEKTEKKFGIEFYYKSDVPIGAGYGASGAMAFGTALCLSRLIPASLNECARIAHIADIKHLGGYGDVVSQLHGGVCIRKTPGIGGIVDNISCHNLKVVSMSFGKLETKKILKNEELTKKISSIGTECLKNLLRTPTIENLMVQSRKFSTHIGLETPRIREAIKAVDRKNKIPASMIMLGESLFTFAEEDAVKNICDALSSFEGNILISDAWRDKYLCSA
ncbi:MAG: pantoate kinase [Candidatus Methanofastidiosia archaeon]